MPACHAPSPIDPPSLVPRSLYVLCAWRSLLGGVSLDNFAKCCYVTGGGAVFIAEFVVEYGGTLPAHHAGAVADVETPSAGGKLGG